jgi:hypothetical protein
VVEHLLTDQEALADVARHVQDNEIRLSVVKKLTDPALLQEICADLVKNAGDMTLRKEAIQRLTSRALLAEIIDGDAAEYLYTWEDTELVYNEESTSYFDLEVTRTLDLRETARERLAELGRTDHRRTGCRSIRPSPSPSYSA